MAKLDLFGLVVQDMAASLNFYRLLGLEIPAEMDSEGHVEVTLPGGLRLAWDSLEVILSFNDAWETPVGHRIGLAFYAIVPPKWTACTMPWWRRDIRATKRHGTPFGVSGTPR